LIGAKRQEGEKMNIMMNSSVESGGRGEFNSEEHRSNYGSNEI
jgi:hypothetical protein